MADNEIEFILHSGDIVDNGGQQNEYDTDYWPNMRTIANEVPIYYAIGNHEYNRISGGDDPTLAVYRANVGYPSDLSFYSFNSTSL